jgi:hypothetical protein
VGRVHGPPFLAALWLTGWAADHYGYLDGLCARSAADPRGLNARRTLNLAESAIVDTYGWTVYEAHLESLSSPAPAPVEIDREAWGADAQAEANQNAMIALFGGT